MGESLFRLIYARNDIKDGRSWEYKQGRELSWAAMKYLYIVAKSLGLKEIYWEWAVHPNGVGDGRGKIRNQL